jgi:hypothetical protein
MWGENFRFILMLMFVATLLRAAYELKPQTKTKAVSILPETHPVQSAAGLTAITAQQRKWSEKAVKRYAEVQEKKWKNWNKAMFESIK